jgi:hypothetical protein
MTLFENWLAETKKLQQEGYKINYELMSGDEPEKINNLVEYIRWNMLAVDDELAEMRQAISWKPWQHDEPYADRFELIKEAVDVLHFVANMLVAAGASDEVLNAVYLEKMEKNRKRQIDGYKVKDAGVKCTLCTRALDEYDTTQCREAACPSKEVVD